MGLPLKRAERAGQVGRAGDGRGPHSGLQAPQEVLDLGEGDLHLWTEDGVLRRKSGKWSDLAYTWARLGTRWVWAARGFREARRVISVELMHSELDRASP